MFFELLALFAIYEVFFDDRKSGGAGADGGSPGASAPGGDGSILYSKVRKTVLAGESSRDFAFRLTGDRSRWEELAWTPRGKVGQGCVNAKGCFKKKIVYEAGAIKIEDLDPWYPGLEVEVPDDWTLSVVVVPSPTSDYDPVPGDSAAVIAAKKLAKKLGIPWKDFTGGDPGASPAGKGADPMPKLPDFSGPDFWTPGKKS